MYKPIVPFCGPWARLGSWLKLMYWGTRHDSPGEGRRSCVWPGLNLSQKCNYYRGVNEYHCYLPVLLLSEYKPLLSRLVTKNSQFPWILKPWVPGVAIAVVLSRLGWRIILSSGLCMMMEAKSTLVIFVIRLSFLSYSRSCLLLALKIVLIYIFYPLYIFLQLES